MKPKALGFIVIALGVVRDCMWSGEYPLTLGVSMLETGQSAILLRSWSRMRMRSGRADYAKHAISRDQALKKGGRDGEENGRCGVQNLPGSRWMDPP